jgi:serine protease Do
MRTLGSRTVAAAALVVVALGGAGTEARGANRRTPIVEAVEKTRAGIVTVKVEKKGSWGRKQMVGTGVIVDERGYVITNQHVVASAERVTVTLADGTELSARVLHEDARADLAVVRVQAKQPLQALPLGPGSDLLVGETVIAVGHPFGYTNTVSTGIVSYVGREIPLPDGGTLRDLIQTNASINPGNSGGPLLNINGELIGINVLMREGAQGIAFALNVDTVQQVLCKLLSAEKVAGVRLGFACRESVSEDGQQRQHVVVDQVAEQGPGTCTGLRRGDELVRLGERSVCNRFDVERALWDHRAGEQVTVLVRRQGKDLLLPLTLAAAGAPQHVAKGDTKVAAAHPE